MTIQTALSYLLFFLLLLYVVGISLFIEVVMAQTKAKKVEVQVGLVVDMDDVWLGKMGLSCVSMAISDFYESHTHYKTRIALNTRDSKNDILGAAAAAVDLLKNVKVQAIIGPITSMQASFVINLGQHTEVPIISFSATSPSLSLPKSPYFIRATINDSAQVQAIGAIVENFGWREVVPIYIESDYGKGIIPSLIEVLQKANTHVPYQSAIDPSATDDQIVEELNKLKKMESRVFIVHMTYALGERLFKKVKQVDMMREGYAWIITDGLTNFLTSLDSSVIQSMQGVLGIQPYVSYWTKDIENFQVRWEKKFQDDNPTVHNPKLNVFGRWAYDATIALAMAVEKVGYANNTRDLQNLDVSANSTDIESLVISQNGKRLREVLSRVRFDGLSGDFHMIGGQLQTQSFRIINLIDDIERKIGFWTPNNRILRNLNDTNSQTSSGPSGDLERIIWPGYTTNAPKSGIRFCIDLFDAIMKAIPYDVPYEYAAFVTPDGRRAGGFNELVDQVYFGKFDAIVGDITITANRSHYLDFTLPFTESGVALVVRTEDRRPKNALVFLKPLTWNLWVTSASLFSFIAFVIWVLEHKNPEFGGSPSRQAATSLWYSFSTLFFAQREHMVSHLARFVVIMWCFVVLILTQSYTAGLTSFLTVEKLQPTISSVKDLARKGGTIGYPNGSFVLRTLEQLNIDSSRLKQYDNMDALDNALASGSENGGFSAAFDETPYMKLLCAKHCPNYTIVEVIQNTSGFGFAFQRGSPLVADVSRAILNVTQGFRMREFSERWFTWGTDCPDPSASASSHSLDLGSFWALFVIVLVSSSISLIIYAAMLLYDHRHFLLQLDIRTLLQKFLMFYASNGGRGGGENNIHQTQGALPFSSIVMTRRLPAASPSTINPSDSTIDENNNSREDNPLDDQSPIPPQVLENIVPYVQQTNTND